MNPAMIDNGKPSREGFGRGGYLLPTAPASPSEPVHPEIDQPIPFIIKENLEHLQKRPSLDGILVEPYPTPPTSSSSSSTHKAGDGNTSTDCASTRHGSLDVVHSPLMQRQISGDDRATIRTRRHTAGLHPLTNIITESSVHASHFSNPTIRYPSTTPSTPKSSNPLSAHSALTSYIDVVKLTDGVAIPSRLKSTPPRTPRALSNDGSETSKSRASPHQDGLNGPRSTSPANGTKSQPSPNTSPPVGPPKGRLSVKISEARGLKPSYDPYAVCVFEYNEAVARNPKSDDVNADRDETRARDFPFSGIPINRSGSDIGRSMAIPMKSRQSSTTSLSDQKNFKAGKQVTNPKWDHRAML